MQHRFLAYTVLSRSSDPAHPVVLGRPDFVAAAPTLPGISRVRLPPASSDRHDGQTMKVSHLHPKNTTPRGARRVVSLTKPVAFRRSVKSQQLE
jgi:hypothetical protein